MIEHKEEVSAKKKNSYRQYSNSVCKGIANEPVHIAAMVTKTNSTLLP